VACGESGPAGDLSAGSQKAQIRSSCGAKPHASLWSFTTKFTHCAYACRSWHICLVLGTIALCLLTKVTLYYLHTLLGDLEDLGRLQPLRKLVGM
jgi:hypothetical protein